MRIRIATIILLATFSARPETLDRIAVTVGKQVITESQIVLDLRAAALVLQQPADLSVEAKRKAAGWRVDQLLMAKEAGDSHLTLPAEESVKSQLDELKSRYASPDLYQADLARHFITEADLADFLLADLREQAFTNLRFGPEIQISEEDLRKQYEARFTNASASPAKAPSFEDKRTELEKELTQQRLTEALDKWLAMARMETRIEYRDRVFQ